MSSSDRRILTTLAALFGVAAGGQLLNAAPGMAAWIAAEQQQPSPKKVTRTVDNIEIVDTRESVEPEKSVATAEPVSLIAEGIDQQAIMEGQTAPKPKTTSVMAAATEKEVKPTPKAVSQNVSAEAKKVPAKMKPTLQKQKLADMYAQMPAAKTAEVMAALSASEAAAFIALMPQDAGAAVLAEMPSDAAVAITREVLRGGI